MAIDRPRVIVVSDDVVRKVRLMICRQLQDPSPLSPIIPEWFGGLVNSWLDCAGCPVAHEVHRG